MIHTKANGKISEAASGKSKDELELLRRQSNEIDTCKSPCKAIVSVLMLKEGRDVRNITVIVGLRAYSAKSNILPEHLVLRANGVPAFKARLGSHKGNLALQIIDPIERR